MRKGLLVLIMLFISLGIIFAAGTPEKKAAVPKVVKEYPTKSIQIIVPWGAGGRTDINARMFASIAPKYLGQPVVVINKAGGGSVIGGEYVAKAKPDGYTLLAITPGTNVFPVIFKKAPYSTFDFDPIGQIGSSTMAIASKPDRPWKDAKGLIAYAKEHPGEVTYACVSLKAPQLGFLRWADKAGLQFKFVPVGNDAEAVGAALGGHVDIAMTSSVATIISHVNAKKLNALMVFAEKRDSHLPNTPTAVELGYNVVASPFTGIAGPKGLPPDVLKKLRDVFSKVIKDPDFIKVMKRIGESINPKSGDDFLAVWKNDYEGYSEIVKKMGLLK
ncbi:MAG: tripartite tricarboxylate transporter substrate binding protein [Spirochaetales bacterium]|nr:tripartite tricarboxylate transporter substrate binding protein [Spirochaetales bacterium]